jgi:hypothetical protein
VKVVKKIRLIDVKGKKTVRDIATLIHNDTDDREETHLVVKPYRVEANRGIKL